MCIRRMRRRCHKCLFFDLCSEDDVLGGCGHFAPLDDDEDKCVDRLIEQGRKEFISEWMEYISEYDDDLFF